MENNEQKVRKQGNVIAGIILLGIGGMMFTISMMVVIFSNLIFNSVKDQFPRNDHFSSISINVSSIIAIIMAVLGLFLAIAGFVCLRLGIRSNRVKTLGHPSVCVVENIETHHYRNSVTKRTLDLAYTGESGARHILKVSIPLYNSRYVTMGTKLRCYVHEEDCYVDIYHLQEVEE